MFSQALQVDDVKQIRYDQNLLLCCPIPKPLMYNWHSWGSLQIFGVGLLALTLIKYSGWQTDYPLRLFNKQYGNFNDASVHESVVMDSKNASTIQALLYHYPYQSISSHIGKINLYTQLGAEKLFNKGKKTTLIYAVLSGIVKFIKMYLIKKGFLDGKEGLILAVLSGFSSTLKYFKLWSLWRVR